MATLTVGLGQQYTTISAAVRATQDGDTVLVQAGSYLNDFITISHKITLQSVGGLAVIQATVAPPNGKAIITTDNDAVIDGFGFTGAAVGDGNGAGIRYDSGNLVVRNSVFWDNQDGILANSWDGGTILIQNSEFSHNGSGDGRTHNIYVGGVASLRVEGSYFHDSVVGHEIKSRAYNTVILNNRIQDNANGTASYSIDLPNGGNDLVQGNMIEKGANASNWITIHYGGEGTPYAGSTLTVADNVIVNDNPNGYLIANQAGTPASLVRNQTWGYAPDHVAVGTVTQTAETTLANRPTLDLSTRAPTVLPPPAVPVTVVVPVGVSNATFGIAGAVHASGHVLTVGGTGTFQSLATALAASVDGDTIQVAAGTYTNDFGTVAHKVIIQGVGGMARFVQTVTDGPAGMLVIQNDATIQNVEFSGVQTGNGHEAAITVSAGNVTIVNSFIHGSDIGLMAFDNAAATVAVFKSEIGPNGNFNKGTNNVQIGAIGSFTLRDSYVHDATTGHEIVDYAYNSDIENNRILDNAATSGWSIDLGAGGAAVIRNNVLEKGRNAINGGLVLVGAERTSYSNTAVQISGNTLITDLANPDHPYTYFINVDAADVGQTTIAGNSFVGGVAGSRQVNGAVGTDSTTRPAGSVTLDGSAPWTAAAAPPLSRPSPAPNTLVVRLSEQTGIFDAQYVVSVDGQAVGGGTVTADHAAGASQTSSFSGWWGAGAHAVTVAFTNAAYKDYAGSMALYVDRVALDGAASAPASLLTVMSPSSTTTLAGTDKLPDFDAAYYLAHNPDVAAAGGNPLNHYMTYGWKEGRDPNAWFDTSYYLAQNPDVAASGGNPLLHYEQYGWHEGRDPSVLFSTKGYLAANPDVAATNVDPLQQFLQSGRAEGRAAVAATPHFVTGGDVLVDAAAYFAQHPSVYAGGIDAASDYHATGWKQGYNPGPWFDTNYYLAHNPDVAATHSDPLMHFETFGWKEGRDPSPHFSISAYNAANPGAASSGVDPLVTYLASGLAPADPVRSAYGTAEARAFDTDYYLAHNPDVAAAHLDALVHYETYGWKEGRNPSATFDTRGYLAANADVAAAHIDPLEHYVKWGQAEGRAVFAAPA